jgi:lipoyl(octanoyl) transferase
MIRTCADHGVEAGRHPEHRGAWVGHKKIGAVGVHLARWITSHGLAFNVAPDLTHFQVIVPCGIADPRLGVTSLAQELAERGRAAPPLAEVEAQLGGHLAALLGRAPEERGPDLLTVSVVGIGPDGRVLLLRRTAARGGFWQPVTGRLEPGESPEAAARRELLEETGADVPVTPLGYRHAFGLEPGLWREAPPGVAVAEETAFAARLPPGFACRLSAEHVEHGWFTPAQALEQLRYAGLRRAVKLATRQALDAPAAVG